jgi:hypothetical protein
MRKLAIAMTAAAVIIGAAGLSAQGKPNFAGKWTLQADPNAAAPAAGAGGGQRGGGGGGGRMGGGGGVGFACGMECTIAQDATSLTLTRTGPAGEIKAVFKLDGSESKNSVAMGQMTMDAVSKATWEGNKLVVTTTADMGGQAMTSKATLSLDATGNMVVEREGGRGPMAPQTYKKG